MLGSYLTLLVAGFAAFGDAVAVVKRQEVEYFALRLTARWRTYNNKWAGITFAEDGNHIIGPAADADYNFFISGGQLSYREGENTWLADFGNNVTSNVEPLILVNAVCEPTGPYTFDNSSRLTLDGHRSWRGCTTYVDGAAFPGVNWLFGGAPPSVPDCQPIELIRVVGT